jgi:hypothetical protein
MYTDEQLTVEVIREELGEVGLEEHVAALKDAERYEVLSVLYGKSWKPELVYEFAQLATKMYNKDIVVGLGEFRGLELRRPLDLGALERAALQKESTRRQTANWTEKQKS